MYVRSDDVTCQLAGVFFGGLVVHQFDALAPHPDKPLLLTVTGNKIVLVA